MSNPLAGVAEALHNTQNIWECYPSGEPVELDMISNSGLVSALDALSVLRRRVDALHAGLSHRIAHLSRPELGAEALAKQQGFRNAAVMISAMTGTTVGEANRSVAVGAATAPRMTFTGETAPTRHPHIAEAVNAGTVGTTAASTIIGMLDKVCVRAGIEATDTAEQMLVENAPGLTTDQLGKLVARVEAYLDPDGIEPREDQLRAERSVIVHERGGMVHLTAKLDPETAAPIVTALEAIITAELRSQHEHTSNHNSNAAGAGVDTADAPDGVGISPAGVTPEHRSLPHMRADALALIAANWLGTGHKTGPATGATVIVRIAWEDLQSGTGFGTIDGINQPVSVSTVRKMGASGTVIPWVMGGNSEILDWGQKRRLFSKHQKQALTERDGGCAMCGLPPAMTKVHHIRWWRRDNGPTNLNNGILLCESCHHRVHNNDWDIRVEGTGVNARSWFIPPPHVDPTQTPRPGFRQHPTLTATAV